MACPTGCREDELFLDLLEQSGPVLLSTTEGLFSDCPFVGRQATDRCPTDIFAGSCWTCRLTSQTGRRRVSSPRKEGSSMCFSGLSCARAQDGIRVPIRWCECARIGEDILHGIACPDYAQGISSSAPESS